MFLLPSIVLSGYIFPLSSLPAPIRVISQILPATHFMGLLKTLFLAGDNWAMFARNCSVLAFYAFILIAASRRSLRKRLL